MNLRSKKDEPATEPEANENPLNVKSKKNVKLSYKIAGELKIDDPGITSQKALDEGKNQAYKQMVVKVADALDTSKSFVAGNDTLKQLAAKRYGKLLSKLKAEEWLLDAARGRYEFEKDVLQNILVLSFADYQDYETILASINRYLAYAFPPDTSIADPRPMDIDLLKRSLNFVLNTYKTDMQRYLTRTENIYEDLRNIDALFSINTFSHNSTIYAGNRKKAQDILNENVGDISRAFMVFLDNLNNPRLFERNYPPRFATANSFRFHISVVPTARAKSLLQAYQISVRDTSLPPYTIPVKHFLKLNLSTGLAFLFAGAIPKAYYFSTPKDQLGDSDFVSIKKGKGTSSLVPKVALFTHLYLTNGKWIKPSLTIGLSTNPADPSETAYLMGGSLIIGNHRRIVLTAGTALANVDRLKSRFNDLVDKEKMKTYFDGIDEAALVEKRLSIGGFFGISYNF